MPFAKDIPIDVCLVHLVDATIVASMFSGIIYKMLILRQELAIAINVFAANVVCCSVTLTLVACIRAVCKSCTHTCRRYATICQAVCGLTLRQSCSRALQFFFNKDKPVLLIQFSLLKGTMTFKKEVFGVKTLVLVGGCPAQCVHLTFLYKHLCIGSGCHIQ